LRHFRAARVGGWIKRFDQRCQAPEARGIVISQAIECYAAEGRRPANSALRAWP
jgi:ribosomal protein S12